MVTVSKHSTHCNPFLFIKKQLQGDNPYTHLINLYKSIEEQIALGHDPMGWRLVRAGLDEILEDMEQIGLIGGRDES